MWVRAAEHFRIQHPGNGDVIGIARGPQYFGHALQSGHRLSHVAWAGLLHPRWPAAAAQYRGRFLHRLHDLAVAGAAAQVAGYPHPDLGLCGRRVLIQDRLGGQQHARRAETALHRAPGEEGLLERVQGVDATESLDSEDAPPLRLEGRVQTSVHGLAVNKYRAGPAFPLPASTLGTG